MAHRADFQAHQTTALGASVALYDGCYCAAHAGVFAGGLGVVGRREQCGAPGDARGDAACAARGRGAIMVTNGTSIALVAAGRVRTTERLYAGRSECGSLL